MIKSIKNLEVILNNVNRLVNYSLETDDCFDVFFCTLTKTK